MWKLRTGLFAGKEIDMKWVLHIYTLAVGLPGVHVQSIEFTNSRSCLEVKMMVDDQAVRDGREKQQRTECVTQG